MSKWRLRSQPDSAKGQSIACHSSLDTFKIAIYVICFFEKLKIESRQKWKEERLQSCHPLGGQHCLEQAPPPGGSVRTRQAGPPPSYSALSCSPVKLS
jgi:hypothetical protein